MKAGEVIVREGAPGDSMFVVVEGMVNVVREEPSGEQRHLASLPEGSFFGEMALVAGTPRLATVIAAQDGLLFEIDRVVLTTLAAIHPEIDRVVHRFYQDRLLSNLLAASPLFRSFSFDDRRSIAARFTLRSLEPHAPILEQDKPGLGFFVILRGQCEVSHVGADGTQHVYPPLREGDHFGEISLLFGTPCTATVRALTHIELLELPPGAFNELVRPNPIVKELVDRIARERLLRTTTLQTKEESVSDSWVV
jgi:cAMP-dependent protein kinase regulator